MLSFCDLKCDRIAEGGQSWHHYATMVTIYLIKFITVVLFIDQFAFIDNLQGSMAVLGVEMLLCQNSGVQEDITRGQTQLFQVVDNASYLDTAVVDSLLHGLLEMSDMVGKLGIGQYFAFVINFYLGCFDIFRKGVWSLAIVDSTDKSQFVFKSFRPFLIK